MAIAAADLIGFDGPHRVFERNTEVPVAIVCDRYLCTVVDALDVQSLVRQRKTQSAVVGQVIAISQGNTTGQGHTIEQHASPAIMIHDTVAWPGQIGVEALPALEAIAAIVADETVVAVTAEQSVVFLRTDEQFIRIAAEQPLREEVGQVMQV